MADFKAELKEPLEETRLPFDDRKQLAVLGHLLTNAKFYEQAKHRVKPDWFNQTAAQKAYKYQLMFGEQFKRHPGLDDLREWQLMVTSEKAEDLAAIRGTILKAKLETANFGLDVIRRELTEWMHARIYQESTLKSVRLYNEKKFSECYQLVSERITQIRTTRFDEENEITFENPECYLEEAEKGYQDALTTGLGIFDQQLRPEGSPPGGGLFIGDTTVLLAPSNVGKTTAMITMSVHNMMAGKHVLFMTHEGRPSDIREKFLQAILNCTKPELFQMYKTPEGMARIQWAIEFARRFLTYIPYNKAGMVIEEVVPIIRRRQEERIANSKRGKGYDLLVSDYPAKLSTERAARGNMAKRNIDEIVYEYYVQLALELSLHSLVAIQTNRQGSKDNRDAERLLTMEDVLESWGVMTSATNVISINRDTDAANKNRVTFLICKSRSSGTHKAIVARSRYGASLTHHPDFGGTWYSGTSTMSDKIDDLLKKYDGQAIPEGTHSV